MTITCCHFAHRGCGWVPSPGNNFTLPKSRGRVWQILSTRLLVLHTLMDVPSSHWMSMQCNLAAVCTRVSLVTTSQSHINTPWIRGCWYHLYRGRYILYRGCWSYTLSYVTRFQLDEFTSLLQGKGYKVCGLLCRPTSVVRVTCCALKKNKFKDEGFSGNAFRITCFILVIAFHLI